MGENLSHRSVAVKRPHGQGSSCNFVRVQRPSLQIGSGLRKAGEEGLGGRVNTAQQRLGVLSYHRTFKIMRVLLQARKQCGSWCKLLDSQSYFATFCGGLSPATSDWFKDLRSLIPA